MNKNISNKIVLVFTFIAIVFCILPSHGEPNTIAPPINSERQIKKEERESKSSEQQQVEKLEGRINYLEGKLKLIKNNESSFWFLWGPWLAGGSALIAILQISYLFWYTRRLRNNLSHHEKAIKKLHKQIGGLEIKFEQERIVNHSRQTAPSPSSQKQTITEYMLKNPVPNDLPFIHTPIATPIPAKIIDPIPLNPEAQETISKASLIAALNSYDRQQLRNASTAELNITAESQNALAIGRAISTELEEVLGGGSYWLIPIQGEHWLFPTDRTLRGFAAAQPSKGLFKYDQKTISQPQLNEPALLERIGSYWVVKSMGTIYTP
jgi:hypothetical protein